VPKGAFIPDDAVDIISYQYYFTLWATAPFHQTSCFLCGNMVLVKISGIIGILYIPLYLLIIIPYLFVFVKGSNKKEDDRGFQIRQSMGAILCDCPLSSH
jgi:hypothetical protein